MQKIFLSLLLLFPLLGSASEYRVAERTCGLFNNLKHTKNQGDAHLEKGRSYEVLRTHKGNFLVKVPSLSPQQRWVSNECFTTKPPIAPLHKQKPSLLLAVSWQEAFCELHQRKRECQPVGIHSGLKSRPKERFTLHGLWPQPRSQEYCGIDTQTKQTDQHHLWKKLEIPRLRSDIQRQLQEVMPAVVSGLHKHEWVKHGSCYSNDINQYFQDAITLVNQVNHSALGVLFRKNVGRVLTLKQIRAVSDRSFGKGTGSRIELRCRRGLITELWFHLGSGSTDLSQLLKEGRAVESRCKRGYVDRAGFGK